MKKLKFFAVLLFSLIGFSVFIYIIKNMKITEISCRSQYGECSALIKEKLEIIKNCDYLTCKKYIDIVLSDARMVDGYSYQFKLPFRIEVNLVEKKPKYSIKSISKNFVAQVDSNGLVLDIRDASNLPGFLIEEDLPNPGEKVSSEEYFALQMVYGASKIQDIVRARFENNFLSVDLKDGKRILFPQEGDRDFILGALTLILNELKKSDSGSRIGEEQIKIIDLRFNNPVLK